GRLDLVDRARCQPELDPRDHLAVPQLRVPVGQAELVGRQPVRTLGVDDQRTLEDRGPVAAVRPGVHPDPTPDRAGDGARELEAAEARGPRPVEADRVGCPGPRNQLLALDLCGRELTREPEDEPFEALVPHAPARAEPY